MAEKIILDILIAINIFLAVSNLWVARKNYRTSLRIDKDADDILKAAKRNEMHARRNIALSKKLHKVERQWIGLKNEV